MDKRRQIALITLTALWMMVTAFSLSAHTEPKSAEPMQSCIQSLEMEAPALDMEKALPAMVGFSGADPLQPGSVLMDMVPISLRTGKSADDGEAVCLEFTEEEKDLLLRIAMAEVGGEECTECLALVMRVVLNRVESGEFGGTIRGVIYSEGQFTPVENGSFEHAGPTERCYDALEMVMNGWDESQGAVYFESNPGTCWHTYNCEYLFRHCNTKFYKQKEQNGGENE